jgi:hypothetical protein
LSSIGPPYPLAFAIVHAGYSVAYLTCAALIWWAAGAGDRSFMPRTWLDRVLSGFLMVTGVGHALVVADIALGGQESFSIADLALRGVGAVFGLTTAVQMLVYRRELARPPVDQVEQLVQKAAAATAAIHEILDAIPPDSPNAKLLRSAWALKARAGELPPLE